METLDRPLAKGCYSESGRLKRVLVCPPTHFQITRPINWIQEQYANHRRPRPVRELMVHQHAGLIAALESEGVAVDVIPPVPGLPYQHATRDVGVAIGDTFVLSNLKEDMRQQEASYAEDVLRQYEWLNVVRSEGIVEGGDVFVDGRNSMLWAGLGARTDARGVAFLRDAFGHRFEVVPLHFQARYTHLDTVFAVLGRGHAITFEEAFDAASLSRIRAAYPSIVSLTPEQQGSAAANVLCVAPDRVISIQRNRAVNERLEELGYTVIAIPFSEVTKSGGSVRCDTLPIDRA